MKNEKSFYLTNFPEEYQHRLATILRRLGHNVLDWYTEADYVVIGVPKAEIEPIRQIQKTVDRPALVIVNDTFIPGDQYYKLLFVSAYSLDLQNALEALYIKEKETAKTTKRLKQMKLNYEKSSEKFHKSTINSWATRQLWTPLDPTQYEVLDTPPRKELVIIVESKMTTEECLIEIQAAKKLMPHVRDTGSFVHDTIQELKVQSIKKDMSSILRLHPHVKSMQLLDMVPGSTSFHYKIKAFIQINK